jgi:HEAT repeat protein
MDHPTDPPQLTIQDWMQGLQHPDPFMRSLAATALGRLGPAAREAIPALRQALGEKDGASRFHISIALAQIDLTADPRPIAIAIQALRDHDRDVRQQAAAFLGARGPDAAVAVPVLIQALQDQDSLLRVHAALALTYISPADASVAAPVVQAAVNDPDPVVHIQAVMTLARIDPPAALPALVHDIQDRPGAASGLAVVSLRKLGPAAREAVPQIITCRDRLGLDEEGFLGLLRAVASHPDWSDPDLLEFAPHFLTSLAWADAVGRLRDFTFYRKVQLKQLSKLSLEGQPRDYLEEAAQEFAMRVLQDGTRKFLRATGKYAALPGVVRNLARAAARALGKGRTDTQGAVRVTTSPDERLMEYAAIAAPGRAAARDVLHDLGTRLQEHVFGRMTGLEQRLVIEHFFKKASRRQLGEIFGRPWEGLRRPLDRVQEELLRVLQLPDRTGLERLSAFVVDELLDGVVPDAVVLQQTQ